VASNRNLRNSCPASRERKRRGHRRGWIVMSGHKQEKGETQNRETGRGRVKKIKETTKRDKREMYNSWIDFRRQKVIPIIDISGQARLKANRGRKGICSKRWGIWKDYYPANRRKEFSIDAESKKKEGNRGGP